MQRTITTTIDIDASPAAVWNVLTATDEFADWNPFIRTIRGELSAGSRLEVEIEPPGGRRMSFRPTVLKAEPERELRWLGKVGVRGLFDGEHSLRIEPLAGGRSRFTQSEVFSGVLVRPFGRVLPKTEHGFEQMNAALRDRAEVTR